MRSLRRCAVALVLVTVGRAAQAQTAARYSVQGSALYAALGGNAFSGIQGGIGFEVQGRVKLPQPAWSLGGGFQSTFHTLNGFSGHETLNGVFVEPRYVIDIQSESLFPYASARGSLLFQSLSSGSVTASAQGEMLNLGGGVLLRLNDRSLLDLGATVGMASLGGLNVADQATGVSFTTASGSGYNFVLRAGLAFALGGR